MFNGALVAHPNKTLRLGLSPTPLENPRLLPSAIPPFSFSAIAIRFLSHCTDQSSHLLSSSALPLSSPRPVVPIRRAFASAATWPDRGERRRPVPIRGPRRSVGECRELGLRWSSNLGAWRWGNETRLLFCRRTTEVMKVKVKLSWVRTGAVRSRRWSRSLLGRSRDEQRGLGFRAPDPAHRVDGPLSWTRYSCSDVILFLRDHLFFFFPIRRSTSFSVVAFEFSTASFSWFLVLEIYGHWSVVASET